VVVARSWFPLDQKITKGTTWAVVRRICLIVPPVETKLREALVHFGNELVNNHCVLLKQTAGLTHYSNMYYKATLSHVLVILSLFVLQSYETNICNPAFCSGPGMIYSLYNFVILCTSVLQK